MYNIYIYPMIFHKHINPHQQTPFKNHTTNPVACRIVTWAGTGGRGCRASDDGPVGLRDT